MTAPNLPIAILPLILVLGSCSNPGNDQSTTTPATGGSTAAARSDYRKPVRMNERGKIDSISLSDFFTLQQSDRTMIFDARAAFFYSLGHIPGAINLTKTNCDEQIAARESEIKAALAVGKTLVVYCSSFTCPDARTVAIHLSGFGYPVKIFSGGWAAWNEADMPY